jgi:hypothetical protein
MQSLYKDAEVKNFYIFWNERRRVS